MYLIDYYHFLSDFLVKKKKVLILQHNIKSSAYGIDVVIRHI